MKNVIGLLKKKGITYTLIKNEGGITTGFLTKDFIINFKNTTFEPDKTSFAIEVVKKGIELKLPLVQYIEDRKIFYIFDPTLVDKRGWIKRLSGYEIVNIFLSYGTIKIRFINVLDYLKNRNEGNGELINSSTSS